MRPDACCTVLFHICPLWALLLAALRLWQSTMLEAQRARYAVAA
jgi:hypothetical protein